VEEGTHQACKRNFKRYNTFLLFFPFCQLLHSTIDAKTTTTTINTTTSTGSGSLQLHYLNNPGKTLRAVIQQQIKAILTRREMSNKKQKQNKTKKYIKQKFLIVFKKTKNTFESPFSFFLSTP